MAEALMTVVEVASYLRVDRATVYRWMQEQGLPYFALSGVRRIDRAELDDWLKTRRVA